jgi:hypothetical protein
MDNLWQAGSTWLPLAVAITRNSDAVASSMASV